jgi:hypothetical protein
MARGNSRAASEVSSSILDDQLRREIGDKKATVTKVRSTVLKMLADYSEAPKGLEDAGEDEIDKAISDSESQVSKKLYEAIGEFGRAMVYYQSNDGDRDKSVLVRAFKDLPPVLQKAFSAKPSELTKMFRGDGSRQYGGLRDVASFTKSEGVASLFGTVLWKGTDIESVEAVIDTAKVSEFFFNDKLEERLEYHPRYKDYSFSIGDDEGEVIAVGIKWKPGVGGDEWAAENKRFRTQR